MAVSAQQIVAKIAPTAKPDYAITFRELAESIVAGNSTTPLRLARFMAQVFVKPARSPYKSNAAMPAIGSDLPAALGLA